MTLAALRTSTSDGTLPAYAWPGAYPIAYLTADGLTICPQCANGSYRRNGRAADGTQRWRQITSDTVTAGFIVWEGPPMPCEDGSACGNMDSDTWIPGMIESAYGGDDES